MERNSQGIRRLDKPDDYVRKEIHLALSLQKRIHVVLVGTAQMPKSEELPKDIAELAKTKSIFKLSSKVDAAECNGYGQSGDN